ncbi:hypothetical protein FZEAL_3931 [Fusarium zealandicum]|uniref:Amino acid permease/ SLC12A domain-containing protein n=1 Tax=Fusarium zealandicum TaxID=1053134 RepID=A0A8H4UNI7_9HYPO|nr:hypothetical protein FZEAL_3931 [Fusarium zealandicum]
MSGRALWGRVLFEHRGVIKSSDQPHVALSQATFEICQGENVEFNLANSHDQLERGLKSRHIQFMALAEAVAAGIIIEYWQPPVNIALWIAIVLIVVLLLSIIAVSFFGEVEFWFASIKLITICGLIILGIVIFFGGGPNQDSVRGFTYWKNPRAFKEFGAKGSTGHFLAYWSAFISAGFAFITSPELIAISAGEAVAARRNIPKAARRFIWRHAIFYGISSLLIGILVSSDDKQLLGATTSDASASPFVIGIQHVGIKCLENIINAAVLTSSWSAGNSFLYYGSRVLYSMALNNQAPKWFRTINKYGVPYVAVLFTWSFVLVTYLRFLRPYATWAVLVIIIILNFTNGFAIFLKGNWDAKSFIAAYITIPIFLVLYLGHKLWFRTSLCIPVENIDVTTGKKEMDELAAQDVPPVPRNLLENIWFWIAQGLRVQLMASIFEI